MSRARTKRQAQREIDEALHPGSVDDFRVPDDLAERWLKEWPAETIEDQYWTPEHVKTRLEDAMDALARSVGRVGPAHAKSLMPEPERAPLTIRDMIEQMHDQGLHKLENKIGMSALSRQISLMEEAIEWPKRYLVDHPGPLRVINTMLVARVYRRPWSKILRKKGIPYSTAKDARARALRIIAEGLNRDEVKVR